MQALEQKLATTREQLNQEQEKTRAHHVAVDQGRLVSAAPLVERIQCLELELAHEREINAKHSIAAKLEVIIAGMREMRDGDMAAHETLRSIQVQLQQRVAPQNEQALAPEMQRAIHAFHAMGSAFGALGR